MKTKKTTLTEVPKDTKRRFEPTVEFPGYREEIELQAYYNYLKRIKNSLPGDEIKDWLDAEKLVRTKIKASW